MGLNLLKVGNIEVYEKVVVSERGKETQKLPYLQNGGQ